MKRGKYLRICMKCFFTICIHAEEIRSNVVCNTNGEISVGGEKVTGFL